MGLPFLTILNMSYMKRVLILLFSMTLLLACNYANEKTCFIDGNISLEEYSNMYLVDYNGNLLDSTFRSSDGSFSFKYTGKDMPRIVVLELRNPRLIKDVVYLPVALESGCVRITIGSRLHMSGTKLNNKIMNFFDGLQQIGDEIQFNVATLDECKRIYSAFYLQKIQENEKNAFGDYLKLAYARELTPEDLEALVDD